MTTKPVQQQGRDADLLAAVAERDRAAFEELYLRYRNRLLGYLRRQLGDGDAAEEALEDTMFAVWTSAQRFDGRSRVSTWVFGIAHNKASKVRRARSRRPEEVPVSEELLPRPPEALRGSALDELRWALGRALDALSPEHRAVVELTYFHDRSYPEVAEIVGCPVNTVKTRMFHARRNLRPVLEELGFRAHSLEPSGG